MEAVTHCKGLYVFAFECLLKKYKMEETTMAKIIGNALPNIPWQDKPQGYDKPVWRYDHNPIIPRDLIPTSNSIFNSAVVPFEGKFAGVADVWRKRHKPDGRSPPLL